MDIIISIIKVVIGFVLLIKGADFFVDGAASVAGKLGIPQIVIGLTIVAFGTSAPEAAISISSAVQHSNGISIGNVIGSNIMNILLILGLTAVIRTLHVKKSTVMVDIPFMIGISVLMAVWGIINKDLNRTAGILFWLLLISFLVYLVIYSKKTDTAGDETEVKNLAVWQIILCIAGGLSAIVFGSNITVDGAKVIAAALGVSDRIIGLTVVAFGTSLPELITSVTAARKGNADIAVGNIVGSNIFNILFVLGTSCLIIDLPYKSNAADFTVDGLIAIAAAVLLWLCVFRNKKLGKAGGAVMLAGYAAYFVYLLV